MHFNTAISSMMILATEMERAESVGEEDYKKFLQILAPFAPHMTEELWSELGEKKSIHISNWPIWDANTIIDEEVKVIIQINGKLKAEMTMPQNADEETVKKQAVLTGQIPKLLEGKEVKKVIYVKNRLINIVV
jgi:leucyl-tRNA synthetase